MNYQLISRSRKKNPIIAGKQSGKMVNNTIMYRKVLRH